MVHAGVQTKQSAHIRGREGGLNEGRVRASSPPNRLFSEPLLRSSSVLSSSIDFEDPDEVEDEDGPEEGDGAMGTKGEVRR